MQIQVWEKLHFHDVMSNGEDFFNRAFEHGYKHKFLKSGTLHLRSGLGKAKQRDQAIYRLKHEVSPVKIFAHSFLTMKPHLIAHYLKARYAT